MTANPLTDLAERVERAGGADRELDALPERIRRRLSICADTGCWNWTSPNSLVGRGRGYVSIAGKPMLHHRAVWTLLRGEIPSGAMLCHHCDNPRCANPAHLYIGDSKSNVRDMFSRGRHWTQQQPERARHLGRIGGKQNDWARGERNPKAKLTPAQVEQVREAKGSSYAVARSFGVNATTVQRIRRGESWN